MKKTNMILLIGILLFSLGVSAACDDISFLSNPTSFTTGDSNSEMWLRILTPGSPTDVWKNYTNATLGLTAQFDNMTSLFKDLTSSTDVTESWTVNGTTSGTYELNMNVYNVTGLACTKKLNVTVNDPVAQPNLSMSLLNLGNYTVNTPINAIVLLNNTGAGDAHNITGTLISAGASFTNSTIYRSILASGTEHNDIHEFKGVSCGDATITASINDYYDASGQLKTPPLPSIQNIHFTGSNLEVISSTISYSSTSVTTGDSVTINFTIRNIGEYNASNANVLLYYDSSNSNVIENKSAGVIEPNQTKQLSYTWNSTPSGSHTIHTQFSADYECTNDHTYDFTQGITATTGSSSQQNSNDGNQPSGGTPGTEDLPLYEADSGGEIEFTIKRGATVRFKISDGEMHRFRLTDLNSTTSEVEIYSDKVEMSIQEGQEKTADIDSDLRGDIKVRLDKIMGIYGKFTITEIGAVVNQTQEENKSIEDEGQETLEDEEKGEDKTGAGELMTGAAVKEGAFKLRKSDIITGIITLIITVIAGLLIFFVWKK